MIQKALAILFTLTAISSASAAINFTVGGFITADPTGTFSVNDVVAINFTLNTASTAGDVDFGSNSTDITWRFNDHGEFDENAPVWTDVAGTNLVGTYTAPTVFRTAPQEQLSIGGTASEIDLGAASYGLNSIGLTLGGNTVTDIIVDLTIDDSFAFLDAPYDVYVDPNTYFANYLGSYLAIVGGFEQGDIRTEAGTTTFDVTSLTISAVPEPSNYALLSGLFMMGLAFCRRHRK